MFAHVLFPSPYPSKPTVALPIQAVMDQPHLSNLSENIKFNGGETEGIENHSDAPAEANSGFGATNGAVASATKGKQRDRDRNK